MSTTENTTALNAYLQNFKDRINDPDIVLLYRLKWAQIEGHIAAQGLKILDFGSGFGTTANYFAKDNDVTAIEPNESMVAARECTHHYRQITGRYEDLSTLANATFDLIICHNVLEFAPERAEIVREFSRLLKPNGVLSIVKNNNEGRIIYKAVANDMEGALKLLNGGKIANTFGTVEVYSPELLEAWGCGLKIERILSLQTFYALQGDHAQKRDLKSGWMDKAFDLEMRVADMEPYKSLSLFNHVLLRKI